jgi:hypothetical protein
MGKSSPTAGCTTCGNTKCSCCGKPLQPKRYTHICWHECICDDCSGPPLTDEELQLIFESERRKEDAFE